MGQAKWVVQRVRSVVVVQARGIVGMQQLSRMMADMRAELDCQPAAKVLFDMRKAVKLFQWADIARIATHQDPPPLDAPVGVLADPAYAPMLWDYCALMARYGRTRLPFTDAARAYGWAGVTETQMVRRHHQELGAALRSPPADTGQTPPLARVDP